MAEVNGSNTNVQNPPAEGAAETTEKVTSDSKDDMVARPTEGDTASQKSYSSVIERFMDRGLTVMNPCKCCMRCCGKNALRIGTFVVAALYIVDGIFNAGAVVVPINFSADQLQDRDGVYTRYYDIQVFSMIVTSNMILVAVVVFFAFYSIASGVLLVFADILMRKRLCFIFTIMAGINILLAFVQIIVISLFVYRDKHPHMRARIPILSIWWVSTFIRMGLLIYYFLCGFALYVQIKDRQNMERVRPDVIEWEDEARK